MGHHVYVPSPLEEWERALDWNRQIHAWHQQNPDAAYWEADAWAEQQGIPRITSAGRIRPGNGCWVMKLQTPVPEGRYMRECRRCSKVEITDNLSRGAGLCSTCRHEELAERKVQQAERRIQRRQERSAQLASRKGCCLVCGAEMTVARITKTTCSDRCRKQWIRKDADAFPLPETPAHARIGEQLVPVAEVAQKFWSLHGNRSLELAMSGQSSKGDEQLQKWEAEARRFERLASLVELREQAPAIFLWEISRDSKKPQP